MPRAETPACACCVVELEPGLGLRVGDGTERRHGIDATRREEHEVRVVAPAQLEAVERPDEVGLRRGSRRRRTGPRARTARRTPRRPRRTGRAPSTSSRVADVSVHEADPARAQPRDVELRARGDGGCRRRRSPTSGWRVARDDADVPADESRAAGDEKPHLAAAPSDGADRSRSIAGAEPVPPSAVSAGSQAPAGALVRVRCSAAHERRPAEVRLGVRARARRRAATAARRRPRRREHRLAERARLSRRHEQAGHAVLDRVVEPSDGRSRRRDARAPSPRGRRRRSPRVATARRGRRRARSTGPSCAGGTKPRPLREQRPQRPVSDDDEREPVARPRRARGRPSPPRAADVEGVRRLVGRATPPAGNATPARDHPHVARAERRGRPPRAPSKHRRRRRRDARGSAADQPSAAPRARRPSPRAGARTACRVASAGSATAASARGRRRRRAPRAAPPARRRGGTAGARSRATDAGGGC